MIRIEASETVRVFDDYGYGLIVQIGAEVATLTEWMLFYTEILEGRFNSLEYKNVLESLWMKHKKQPKEAYYIEKPIHAICPAWAKYLRVAFNGSVNTFFDEEIFTRSQSATLLTKRHTEDGYFVLTQNVKTATM